MADLEAPKGARLQSPASAPPLYPVYRDDEGIRLVEIVAWFYAERYLAMTLIALAGAAALAIVLWMPPVYRAEVLLAPVSHEGADGLSALVDQLGPLAALVGNLPGAGADRTAESIATLRSRSLALEFIRKYDLKPRLLARRWDEEAKDWRPGEPPPTELEAYRRFDRDVRHVEVDRRSGLVSLAVEWTDANLAADWANRLVAEVNARQRSAAIREARQSIEYFERQLRETSSVEVRQAIYRLIESQMKTIALASARDEYAFKVIDPAVAPEKPSAPKPVIVLAAGFCLGVVLAAAVVLLKRALRDWRAALQAPG